jgi:hypothetical protein
MRNHIVPPVVLAVLFPAAAFWSGSPAGRAAAQPAGPNVTVVNTQANPVPVTGSLSGSVSVTSSPQSPVHVTGAVSISNNTVPVSGSVSISNNTLPVAGTVQAVQSGLWNITLNNSAANPVPVRTQFRPLYFTRIVNVTGAVATSNFQAFPIAQDEIVRVENLSYWCYGGQVGERLMIAARYDAENVAVPAGIPLEVGDAFVFLPLTEAMPDPQSGVSNTIPVTLHLLPNRRMNFRIARITPNPQGAVTCEFFVSGHFNKQ